MINKREFIDKIAAETGLPKNDVSVVFSAAMNEIVAILASGESLSIRNFALFTTKRRRPKMGRNFNNEKPIHIGERREPVVKFSKEIKKWVQQNLRPM